MLQREANESLQSFFIRLLSSTLASFSCQGAARGRAIPCPSVIGGRQLDRRFPDEVLLTSCTILIQLPGEEDEDEKEEEEVHRVNKDEEETED